MNECRRGRERERGYEGFCRSISGSKVGRPVSFWLGESLLGREARFEAEAEGTLAVGRWKSQRWLLFVVVWSGLWGCGLNQSINQLNQD